VDVVCAVTALEVELFMRWRARGNPGINNVRLSGAFVIGAWRDFGFFVIGHVSHPAPG
jgi:hypothetical protein